ncbi:hypothetical protein [Dulcicalothrix desertica]|uniref:hypothetical protein n=1 Tax=Dulcicalothrix desertica TaxID=32056 RepID=UPI001647B7AE|nr:hypothetical protein [Dulcicalothrix desertica]
MLQGIANNTKIRRLGYAYTGTQPTESKIYPVLRNACRDRINPVSTSVPKDV